MESELIFDLQTTTIDEVLKVAKTKIATGLELCRVVIYNPLSFSHMIEKGFYPYLNRDLYHTIQFGYGELAAHQVFSLAIEYKVQGWSDNLITFLTNGQYILNLDSWPYWVYASLEYYKRKALSISSMPLRLFGAQFLYASNRLRTDMSIFETANTTYWNCQKLGSNLPVTRYVASDKNSLFYQSSDTNYCGTFYYFEPESSTRLTFESYCRFSNKYQAYLSLSLQLGLYIEPIAIKTFKQGIAPNLVNKFFKNDDVKAVYASPQQLYEQYPSKFNHESQKLLATLKNDEVIYLGQWLGAYAKEDIFDQLICELAQEAGYDIVILEHMIGSHQLTTEILDTRSRIKSLDSLVFNVPTDYSSLL